MSGKGSQQAPGAVGSWQFNPGDTSGSDSAQEADAESPKSSEQQPAPHPDAYLPDAPPSKVPAANANETVLWSASEFIDHHKSLGWYAILALATAAFAAAVLFVTKDKVSTGVIIIAGIILGASAARKPRTLEYRVDRSGLTIGQKFYGYDQFRSFAVVDEDAFASIVLMPLKRFMPLLTIYYDPKDEEKIIGVLSNWLPMETHKLDVVDQFMRRIRF